MPLSLGPSDADLELWRWRDRHKDATLAYQKWATTNNINDLETAIRHARTAVEKPPPGANVIAGPGLLNLLGILLTERFMVSGHPVDADGSARYLCRAIAELNPDRSQDETEGTQKMFMYNLQRCLVGRCKKTNKQSDVDAAIAILHELKIPECETDFLGRCTVGLIFAEMSLLGYEMTQDVNYLDQGVSMVKSVRENARLQANDVEQLDAGTLQLLYGFELDAHIAVGNLAYARFKALETDSDWETAVESYEKTLDMTTDIPRNGTSGIASSRLIAMRNLSVAFRRKYELTDTFSYLEKGVEISLTAIDAGPPSQDEVPIVRDLIGGLQIMFEWWYERTSTLPPVTVGDVLVSPLVFHLIPDAMPEHDKATWVCETAARAEDRFIDLCSQSEGDDTAEEATKELERAVLMTGNAMNSTNPRHPDWGKMETAERRRLRMWSERTGKCPDSEVAIMTFADGGVWMPPELMANDMQGTTLMMGTAFHYGKLSESDDDDDDDGLD
ncbi:hypothetical protein B0H63DRAFT_469868 [Podospora didyma]|uniref:Uncharacterized protein n=1 Tax=Podospora didyma TaxID=330526 RepID=A0AAE0NTB9_9PEZI|nr:hypothetical protein B0H63DRAFT_469868 [Podospora didyma]